jgi:hypothetical protein
MKILTVTGGRLARVWGATERSRWLDSAGNSPDRRDDGCCCCCPLHALSRPERPGSLSPLLGPILYPVVSTPTSTPHLSPPFNSSRRVSSVCSTSSRQFSSRLDSPCPSPSPNAERRPVDSEDSSDRDRDPNDRPATDRPVYHSRPAKHRIHGTWASIVSRIPLLGSVPAPVAEGGVTATQLKVLFGGLVAYSDETAAATLQLPSIPTCSPFG